MPLPIQHHRQRQRRWRAPLLPLLLRRCRPGLCVLLHPKRRLLGLVRQLCVQLSLLTLLSLLSLVTGTTTRGWGRGA